MAQILALANLAITALSRIDEGTAIAREAAKLAREIVELFHRAPSLTPQEIDDEIAKIRHQLEIDEEKNRETARRAYLAAHGADEGADADGTG